MPMRTIALTDQEESLITRLVQSGRYRDAGDVLSNGLTLIGAREDLVRDAEPQPSMASRALDPAELVDLQTLIVEVDEARQRAAPISLDEILAWRDEGRA